MFFTTLFFLFLVSGHSYACTLYFESLVAMSSELTTVHNNAELMWSDFDNLCRDAEAHLEQRFAAMLSIERFQRDNAIAKLKVDLLSEISVQVGALEQKTFSRDEEVRHILARVEDGMRGLVAQGDSNSVLAMVGMSRVASTNSPKNNRHEQIVDELKRQDGRLAKLEIEVQSLRSQASLENVMEVASAEQRILKEIERLRDYTEQELRKLELARSTDTFQGEPTKMRSSGYLSFSSFKNLGNTETSIARSSATIVRSADEGETELAKPSI